MWQELLQSVNFLVVLLGVDRELAARAREQGCGRCGGRLHVANYERKPRGGPTEKVPGSTLRLSFCCGEEGCRARVTPPSVRFLARRVYLAATVVLLAVLVEGETPRRVQQLRELVGVDRRTLVRWRAWWRGQFARSEVWTRVRGRLSEPVAAHDLPGGLLVRMAGEAAEKLLGLLRLLAGGLDPGSVMLVDGRTAPAEDAQ